MRGVSSEEITKLYTCENGGKLMTSYCAVIYEFILGTVPFKSQSWTAGRMFYELS